MQLLVQAREQLPPAACTLGTSSPSSSGSCSSRNDDSSSVLAQQRQAWQLTCAHLQHNLLLVISLTKSWDRDNTFLSFGKVLHNKM